MYKYSMCALWKIQRFGDLGFLVTSGLHCGRSRRDSQPSADGVRVMKLLRCEIWYGL